MILTNGQILYRQGDPSKSMFVIRSGKITLFVQRGDKTVELLTLGPGQIVGDLAFFNGQTRTSFARAVGPTECIELFYDQVRPQFEASPSWLQILSKTLAEQVIQYSQQLRKMKTPSDPRPWPALRVCRCLAILTLITDVFGQREDGDQPQLEWGSLRSYATFAFQESATQLLGLAHILEGTGYLSLEKRDKEPLRLKILQPSLLRGLLAFYNGRLAKGDTSLLHIDVRQVQALQVLREMASALQPDHRGLVTIVLADFADVAHRLGYTDLLASAVDMLSDRGIQFSKGTSDQGVTVTFHRDEFTAMAGYGAFLWEIQKINGPEL